MLLDPVFSCGAAGHFLCRHPGTTSTERCKGRPALRVPEWSLPAVADHASGGALVLSCSRSSPWPRWSSASGVCAESPPRGARECSLTVGLFGLGIMPQALQRPDTTHLSWVSCVPLAFFPAVVAEVLGHVRIRRLRLRAGVLGAAAGLGLLLVAYPHFTYRTYGDLTNQTFGRGHIRLSACSEEDRVFYLGSAAGGRGRPPTRCRSLTAGQGR